jgi:hypothetical protein
MRRAEREILCTTNSLRTVEDARYLAGPKEVGAVLGVEANTVNVWQRRSGGSRPFPAPVVRLAGTAVWDIRRVIEWADATGRDVVTRDYTAPGWCSDKPNIHMTEA